MACTARVALTRAVSCMQLKTMSEALRLLIVDDSALMRHTLRLMLESDPAICVVGEAANGREALQRVAELRPDVITMDVRMPVMDGLETTEQLMAYYPTPILVLTASLSRYDIDITFKMLGAGALDVMEKPTLNGPGDIERARYELVRRIKLLARVKVVTHLRGRRRLESRETSGAHTSLRVVERPPTPPPAANGKHAYLSIPRLALQRGNGTGRNRIAPLVVIGASTGGPRVIQQILRSLPRDFGAAVLLIQHIADGFSLGMVEWLAESCAMPVSLATEGAPVASGTVLVAPACHDLLVEADGRIHLSSQPLLLQRPSIDITMQSAAEICDGRLVGVLLTGMGRDGAEGMLSIRRAGGYTIAQNEASCTIYGMPRAAVELGAVDAVLPPEEIILALQRWAGPA